MAVPFILHENSGAPIGERRRRKKVDSFSKEVLIEENARKTINVQTSAIVPQKSAL
jgi:hypothetical protein